MQTVSIPRFGGPEVLTVVEKEARRPGPGEVSLDVAYAGVNYAEVLFRRGVVPGLKLPFTPGIEVSGHVREVGEGVAGLWTGQRVAALTIVGGGGYAEGAVAQASLVVPLPDGVPLAPGAAVPSNATTAYLVLREVAHLTQGETVVVHAAAGGVGSSLGQTARSLGAGTVVGVVGSPGKVEYGKRLGYDDVVLSDGFEVAVADLTGGRGADVAVDQVGGGVRRPSLELLRPAGGWS
jgi:NADPH2:quinone reductase